MLLFQFKKAQLDNERQVSILKDWQKVRSVGLRDLEKENQGKGTGIEDKVL